MEEVQNVLAWLMCYGHWNPAYRPPLETIGHNQYLDKFVESMIPIKERVDYIYISGGVIDSRGKTEYQTVKPELDRRLSEVDLKVPLLADVGSIVDISSIKTFCKTLKETYSNHTPLLFCSSARYQVDYFLLDYFGKQFGLSLNPAATVVPLSVIDIRPDSHPRTLEDLMKRMRAEGVEKVESQEVDKRRVRIL